MDWASYWAGAAIRWARHRDCSMLDVERCLRRFDSNVAALASDERQRAAVLRDAIVRATRWAVLGESLEGGSRAA